MPGEYPDDVRSYFGKYKGKKLREIPSGYLYWMAANCDDDYLATAADKLWRLREEDGEHWEDVE